MILPGVLSRLFATPQSSPGKFLSTTRIMHAKMARFRRLGKGSSIVLVTLTGIVHLYYTLSTYIIHGKCIHAYKRVEFYGEMMFQQILKTSGIMTYDRHCTSYITLMHICKT